MRKFSIFNRQRFTACLFYVFYMMLIFLISGCGGGSDDSLSPGLSETGSASFNVAWHDAPVVQASGNNLMPAAEPVPVDCESIQNIICEVRDESDAPLVSESFVCGAGHGTIDNIPVGANRKFVVLGEDPAGNILYHGVTPGITISAGQTSDVGTIDTYYFIPTGLSATTVSSSQISLTWNASASTDADVGYNVYRGVELLDSVTSNSYSDTGLSPSTQYCYTVSAYDAGENGAEGYESYPSDEVCQSTGPDDEAPSTPTGLSATAVSSSQISLTWTASTDNVGVAGYRIYRDESFLKSVTTTSTSDTGLNPSTQYCYAISAYDAAENESEQSNQSCDTTDPAPINPPPTPDPMIWATEPTATSTSAISMTATTASDPDTPITYQFDFVNSPTGGLNGTDSVWQSSTTYNDSGLGINQQYGYRVRARDGDGNTTGYSPTSYAYTLASIPGYPSGGPFYKVTEISILVTWTANGNPSGTEYYCENMDNGTNSGWITNTNWNSTGLTCGTSYEFRVKARNGDGKETNWRYLDNTYTQICSIVTFDLEEFTPTYTDISGNDPRPGAHTSLSSTKSGITIDIYRQGSKRFDTTTTVASAFDDVSLDPFYDTYLGAFIVNFSVPVASVSVDMGDYNGGTIGSVTYPIENDDLLLQAYIDDNASGTMLDSDTDDLIDSGNINPWQFNYRTLSVGPAGNCIKSVKMIGGNGPTGNSVFYDNIVVERCP
jgi:chitodextrinase